MRPIRCYTCGKVLGRYYEKVDELLRSGMTYSQIFLRLSITRYCCKRVFMTCEDTEEIHEFTLPPNTRIIHETETINIYSTN